MSFKNALLVSGLIAAIFFINPAADVLAREPAPPTDAEKIIGPTMWAVGVVACGTTPYATLRVKKIEDCNVDTDPLAGSGTELGFGGCPASQSDVLYVRLPQGSVFGLDSTCEPIVTKVKNFKTDGNTVSFDAQIQFVVPTGYAGEECGAASP